MKKLNKSESVFRFLVYILPGVLFFSYYPLIHFGSDASMNFEISLPMIWLVLFDLLALWLLIKKKLFKKIFRFWYLFLLPAFLTLSVAWSLNMIRGVLTVGILWLIYLAGVSFWLLRDLFRVDSFKEKFWRVFFGYTIVICVWCLMQCILDLIGVSDEYTLMCVGCTYKMFGFPHPNGFAIEPQFMGNLLLAPAIIICIKILAVACPSDTLRAALAKSLCSEKHVTAKTFIQALIIITTLFLTFSRGAIYAFVVAMIVLTIAVCRGSKSLFWDRKLGRTASSVSQNKLFRALGRVWLFIIIAFIIAVNVQGVMAEVGPTDDTYSSGVAKVLNHLSLGVIDVRDLKKEMRNDEVSEKKSSDDEAVFDGYVAESTDTRVRLTGAAFKIWSKDLKTILFGVGLGGAGQALYTNGLSPAPKEIVQNEYASILLETGIVGLLLAAFTIIVIVVKMNKHKIILPTFVIMIAYGVTLLFFSGLANALQIYLLPALFISFYERN